MTIIGARKISYAVSGTLVVLSLIALAVWGLRLGIDFTGGSILEVKWKNARPANERVGEIFKLVGIEHNVLQPTGEHGLILRISNIDEAKHQELKTKLSLLGEFEEKRFNAIGPTIGQELKRKSLWAMAVVLIMIVSYIAWAFRHPPAGGSKPVQSWKYGIAAIVALIHDVSIPTGIFAILGHFYNVEVDTLFVTALLTILGFSVHDTIVVFDRIRENLKKMPASTRLGGGGGRADFEAVVEQSIRDTIARSINTSLTVMIVMLTLYFFGGASTKYFSLAILIGVGFGTYSSIFIASALLVSWNKWSLARSARH